MIKSPPTQVKKKQATRQTDSKKQGRGAGSSVPRSKDRGKDTDRSRPRDKTKEKETTAEVNHGNQPITIDTQIH